MRQLGHALHVQVGDCPEDGHTVTVRRCFEE